ncbi:GerW family sporulation protein [Evansella sp. AB-rgal1]|uniref:GerW family sporulation protein n=1 Tax=Evansella sp. AB-rgal1 TaxID=3242696 RepID=UPI00359DA02D
MKNGASKDTHVETKSKDNQYEMPVKPLFDKFAKNKDVSLVFGEPIVLENKRVLPVAKVRYSFGGGSGFTEGTETSPSGHGGGGGGHVSVTPVGVYDITPKSTKFKPVVDAKLGVLSVLSLGVFLLLWKSRKKEKTNRLT